METHNPGVDKAKFGKKLNLLRKRMKVSSEELSEAIGKNSGGYVRMVESAQTGVSVDALVDLCNALNTTPEYLLSDSLKNTDTMADLIKKLTPSQYSVIMRLIKTMIEDNDACGGI